jgi:hypothetical protein
MNRNDVEKKIAEATTTDVVEVGATNSYLHTLLEEISVGEEFCVLRETLRLYFKEMTIH